MGVSLELEAVHNLRDIGGVPGLDGRLVQEGRLFRSGTPDQMTDADRRTLRDLGITTMIDLRSEYEQGHSPYEWNRKVSAPVAHDHRVAGIFERFDAGTLTSEELEDWWALTQVYEAPFDHLDAIRTVFRTLLESKDDEAILLHCTGGKDRTGLVAALILEALGTPRDAIREDFLRTNTDVEELVERSEEFAAFMEKAKRSGLTPDALFSLTGVKTEWLDKLIGRIEERQGSVIGYLANDVGIGDEGVVELRQLYLV